MKVFPRESRRRVRLLLLKRSSLQQTRSSLEQHCASWLLRANNLFNLSAFDAARRCGKLNRDERLPLLFVSATNIHPEWQIIDNIQERLRANFLKLSQTSEAELENDVLSLLLNADSRSTKTKETALQSTSDYPWLQYSDSPTTAALLTTLHKACSFVSCSQNNCAEISSSCSEISQVNQTDHEGRTPLHVLIHSYSHFPAEVGNAIARCLIAWGANLTLRDNFHNTPLLTVRHLLKVCAFHSAYNATLVLLSAGANLSDMDQEGYSLLSLSVGFLDSSFDISELLLGCGACVWSGGCHNPFDSFLRSVIRLRRVANCERTLSLLCAAMQEHPWRMRQVVLRTMFRHGKFYRILGPVFLRIKLYLQSCWTEPLPLKVICRRTIRRCMSKKSSIARDVDLLYLPPQLKEFLLYK